MVNEKTPTDPTTARTKPTAFARRLIFGSPIHNEHAEHTLLPKRLALPVFASDAISSVAYATQQIVLALGAAGLFAAGQSALYGRFTLGVTALIVGLLFVVVLSYWQTIFGYPSGGGSYIVSRENLGVGAGLIAAAALLIDYVLTVSVSIAAGVQNLKDVPLFGSWHVERHLVLYCLLAIGILTLVNLRGLKESGAVFAIPTYLFVAMCYLMIGIGIFGPLFQWRFHPEFVNQQWRSGRTLETFGLAVLLRAFANGCSAMTGTEAVSNGIPAFKENKSRNAALTLVAMGVILGTIFLGISWLAVRFHVVYWEADGKTAASVIDQVSGAVFGKTGPTSFLYVLVQISTALVLVLAANTSFADFPRLAGILAKDGFLPRQLTSLGDKLVFNNGILVLGTLAGLLVWAKNGSVDALIPLYAIGVFLAFTLSQTGMVVHWRKERGPGWSRKAVINAVGGVATALVLADIAYEKFLEGAWIVILLIGALVLAFRKVRDHYSQVKLDLNLTDREYALAREGIDRPPVNTVVVLIAGIHRGTIPAMRYARSLSADCRAVYVEMNPEKTATLKERWERVADDMPLDIVKSPYRRLTAPLMAYLSELRSECGEGTITVVVPEMVLTKWWHHFLHGHTGLALKIALLARPDVIVANIRYPLTRGHGKLPSKEAVEY